MSKDKKPKAKINPSTDKQPKIASAPTSFHNMKPSWRISGIDMREPYGWHTLDANMLLYIKNKLTSFESMTWAEILIQGKKSNHTVAVGNLSSEAQCRLREINQDDVDELVSLRLSGKERVWGILDQGVLTLILYGGTQNTKFAHLFKNIHRSLFSLCCISYNSLKFG